MTFDNPLQLKANEILEEIAKLGPMRKGSLCKRMLKRKTASGQIKTRGPYWYYTFKNGKKTVCKMLSQESATVVREQIERFRSFQSLTQQYAEMSRRLADREVENSHAKKNSSKRSATSRKPRRGGSLKK